MAEVSPETAKASPTASPAQATKEGVATASIITESRIAGDQPRETLTKVARLKQEVTRAGGYAITGLAVLGFILQFTASMVPKEE